MKQHRRAHVDVEDELKDLAVRLAGDSWTRKFEQEWSPVERLRRDRMVAAMKAGDTVAETEIFAWLDWMLHGPYPGLEEFEDDEKVWEERNGVVLYTRFHDPPLGELELEWEAERLAWHGAHPH